MFFQRLTNIPFADEDAGLVFGSRIYGDAYDGDNTFLATLRALVHSRMPEEEHLCFRVFDMNSDELEFIRDRDAILLGNQLSVVKVRADTPEKALENMAKASAILEEMGYKERKTVQLFYKRVMPAMGFYHEGTRNSILFAHGVDMRLYHFLQCCVPTVLPWYFPTDERGHTPLADDEKALASSFQRSDRNVYLKALKDIAKKYDFSDVLLRKKLEGFETRIRDSQIQNVRERIENVEREIVNYREAIQSYLADRDKYLIQLHGLRAMRSAGEGDSDLLTYFLCNKHVHLDRTEGSSIYFTAFGNAADCDEDIVESYLDNEYADLYDRADRDGYSYDDTRRVMSAIFLDHTINLRFVAKYRIDMIRGITGISGWDDEDGEYDGYMPNPHIYYHSCLGSYESVLTQLTMDGNYLAAMEQCLMSALSLNWADGIVFDEFMSDLCHRKVKCLELPDGTITDFDGALKYLNE